MNSPNKKLMQELIAKLEGWTKITYPVGSRGSTIHEVAWKAPGASEEKAFLPNWVEDRNIELLVDHWGEFLFAFGEIIDQKIPYWMDVPHAVVVRLLKATTIELRLAWIRSWGYRWVPCTKCNGRGEREQKNTVHKDVTRLPSCPDCHGDKGEFVKI